MKTVLVALVITTNWISDWEPVIMAPVVTNVITAGDHQYPIYGYEERELTDKRERGPGWYYTHREKITKVVKTNYLPVVEMEVPDE